MPASVASWERCHGNLALLCKPCWLAALRMLLTQTCCTAHYLTPASQVGLLACKFMDAGGSGLLSDAVGCIHWCSDQGASVISASFGSLNTDPRSSTGRAMSDAIQRFNGLFVAAAGNDGLSLDSNAFIPGGFTGLPNMVTVAASG